MSRRLGLCLRLETCLNIRMEGPPFSDYSDDEFDALCRSIEVYQEVCNSILANPTINALVGRRLYMESLQPQPRGSRVLKLITAPVSALRSDGSVIYGVTLNRYVNQGETVSDVGTSELQTVALPIAIAERKRGRVVITEDPLLAQQVLDLQPRKDRHGQIVPEPERRYQATLELSVLIGEWLSGVSRINEGTLLQLPTQPLANFEGLGIEGMLPPPGEDTVNYTYQYDPSQSLEWLM